MSLDLTAATLGASGAAVAMHALTRLREHRTEPTGVADLLAWGFLVDEGVMLQKDGSLLTAWSYRGPDMGAATAEALHQLTTHVAAALGPLTDHWMVHVDAVRRAAAPYPAATWPNAVTALMDAERRAAYHAHGQHFETEYVLTVTYLPPADAFARLSGWFVQLGSANRDTTSSVDWTQLLAAFTAACQTFEQHLSAVLQLTRLTSRALLTHLHRCLTGLEHAVEVPPHGAYLNTVLADQELVGGFVPCIGTQHIRAIAIHGFPTASHAGHLDVLHTLSLPYRWSTRVLPIGQATAATLIRRHQLRWFQKRKGASAWIREMTSRSPAPATPNTTDDAFLDHDAQRMVHDASDALAENSEGALRFCFTTQVLVVMDADPARADQIAQTLAKTVRNVGFTARIETVNALEAYLGTLPGHGYHNVRRPLLSAANVADLLPVTSVWPGLAHNPSSYFPPQSPPLLWAKTEGSTPFRLNLHEGDVGHTLIVGATGKGKSTLVGLLTAQFQRYPAAQVFVFDVGYSAWALAQAAGARHYDIAAGAVDTLTFQPLAAIHDGTERAWAADWLETLVTLQGVTVTPPLRARLEIALQLIAHNATEHRTLTELTVHLQHPDLVAAITPYTIRGLYGRLLDATEDALQDTATGGRYQVFELRHLMEMDDKILIPTALYLFHRIEQRLDGSPTLLVFEELWAALMRSTFATRIKQWLLTLRKQNTAVALVAHSVGQLAEVPHRHVILESCPTRIFLPNPDAAARETAALYEDVGLNRREIDIIARAIPKREYYITSPSGRRLVELGLGPVALAFLATPAGMTAEDMRRHIRRLQAAHGAAWPATWLRERGLSAWAEQYLHWSADTPRHDTDLPDVPTPASSFPPAGASDVPTIA